MPHVHPMHQSAAHISEHVRTMFLAKIVIAIIAGCALSSCATYYAVEATLPATVPETADAMEKVLQNISDLSYIPDATTVNDSATLRYLGLQGVPTTSGRLVRTIPKFGVRLQPEGNQSTMAVTSVGGDQYAKLVIIATEQELLHRALVRTDSSNAAPPGALPVKSALLHQILNAVTPVLGMLYVQRDNPYKSPTAFSEAMIVGATDVVGLYLLATSAGGAFGQHHERNKQYKFLIGMVISALLRNTYGTQGFLQVQQYNALSDSPYNLQSSYVDSRIATIGITVRFP